MVTVVDDEDYELLSKYTWYALKTKGGYSYAVRALPGKKKEYMHRVIMGAELDREVDHISGDTLFNVRRNLRVVTRSNNQMNRKTPSNSSSGYKGVSKNFDGKKKPWIARIYVGGKRIRIGTFYTSEEAAMAYDNAALQYFGEFARLNRVGRRQ